jgi:hypothetical protein
MRTTEQNRLFEIVNNFLGSGDPIEHGPGIWFIGIEEAAGWKSKEEVEKVQGKWYVPGEGEVKVDRGKVYPWIAKIVCVSRGETKANANWRNSLFRRGNKVFVANLFPLGKPKTTDWDNSYEKLFGYGPQDLKEYEENVKATRFIEFSNHWNESRPKATVCFGTSRRKDFERLFSPGKINFEPLTYDILCNEEKRILLTQHPSSRHWNKDQKGSAKLLAIQQQLSKWGINLPWVLVNMTE